MQTQKFQSEKGLVPALVIWGAVALQLIVVIRLIAKEISITSLILSFFSLVIVSLLLWLWFSTFYEIRGNTLFYRSGPIHGSIEVQRIIAIKKNKTLWSGLKPALSFKGLIIKYNKWDEIYLSPEEKDSFITELVKLNNKIKVEA